MNERFTPGPWGPAHSEDLRGGTYWVVQIPNRDTIDIHETDNGEADAHLVAAAPDLYAALMNTLSLLKLFTRETDAVAKAAWDEADAALMKAALPVTEG